MRQSVWPKLSTLRSRLCFDLLQRQQKPYQLDNYPYNTKRWVFTNEFKAKRIPKCPPIGGETLGHSNKFAAPNLGDEIWGQKLHQSKAHPLLRTTCHYNVLLYLPSFCCNYSWNATTQTNLHAGDTIFLATTLHLNKQHFNTLSRHKLRQNSAKTKSIEPFLNTWTKGQLTPKLNILYQKRSTIPARLHV